MASEKPTLQAQYEFLTLPALRGGIDALQDWERSALAMLYVKETRKGAFRYSGSGSDRDHIQEFLEHVDAHFATTEDLKVVLDFQPRLLATAKDLSHRKHPIESVILYATWCEHWLNATIITTALANGCSETDAVAMIRNTNLPGKVGWLWRSLKLPDMPAELSKAIAFLAEVRNEHVHYKWQGHDPDVLAGTDNRLSLAIADVERTIEQLIDFEVTLLVGSQLAVAERLFKLSLATEWKAVALKRPLSAPRIVEVPTDV